MALRAAALLALGLTAASALEIAGEGEDERPSFFRRRSRQAETTSTRTKPLRVHVSSIGGVGTTGFMEELKQMKPTIVTNDPIDNDQIKHVPYSKLIQARGFQKEKPEKIVYLYGDPTRAIMSLDRRGWFLIQGRKTRTDPFPHPFPKNLKQYVDDMSEDFFQFEKHFDSFYKQCDIPVAFLRVKEKTDHVAELAQFLETNTSEVRRVLVPWKQVKMVGSSRVIGKDQQELEASVVPLEFNPDVLPSNNDYSEVSQEVKDKLKGKLAGLLKKYDSLPGFKSIIPGRDCKKQE